MAGRDATERRLRAVGRGGRLARWHGDVGEPEPGHGTTRPAATGRRDTRPTGGREAKPAGGRDDQGRRRTGHPPRRATRPAPGERPQSSDISPDGALTPHTPRPPVARIRPEQPNGTGAGPAAQSTAREEHDPPPRPAGHRPR